MASEDTSAGVRHAKAFGTKVMALRKARGMSRPQLAIKAHVSRSTVWRIETAKGKDVPSSGTIAAIAEALDADLDELLEAAGRTVDQQTFEQGVRAKLDSILELVNGHNARFDRLDAALARLGED